MASKAKTEVATQSSGGGAVQTFDDDMLNEAAEYAGAGTSNSADDNVLPFLSLLQDMTPQAKKRDALYVEGAEPGFMLNKATRKLFDTHLPVDEQTSPLIVQPCAFHRCVNEWVPRDQGGGFIARHEILPGEKIDDTMKRLGGKQVKDPRDSKGEKLIWRLENGHDLIDTRYQYVNVLDEDGNVVGPAVMSFSSTGHTPARQWMTLQRNAKLAGRVEPAPSWFKKYRVRSIPRENESGDFFVLTIDDLGDDGWIRDARVRAQGLELNKAFSAGAVKAGVEDEGGGVKDDDRGANI